MSDCERCWNTPCSCGWEGYLVVYVGSAVRVVPRETLDAMKKRFESELKAEIEKYADKLCSKCRHPKHEAECADYFCRCR